MHLCFKSNIICYTARVFSFTLILALICSQLCIMVDWVPACTLATTNPYNTISSKFNQIFTVHSISCILYHSSAPQANTLHRSFAPYSCAHNIMVILFWMIKWMETKRQVWSWVMQSKFYIHYTLLHLLHCSAHSPFSTGQIYCNQLPITWNPSTSSINHPLYCSMTSLYSAIAIRNAVHFPPPPVCILYRLSPPSSDCSISR